MEALIAGNEDRNAAAEAAPVAVDAADAGNSAAAPRQSRQRESNVGQALRSVYQQTVNEDVPDEMLKLLGKLT